MKQSRKALQDKAFRDFLIKFTAVRDTAVLLYGIQQQNTLLLYGIQQCRCIGYSSEGRFGAQ